MKLALLGFVALIAASGADAATVGAKEIFPIKFKATCKVAESHFGSCVKIFDLQVFVDAGREVKSITTNVTKTSPGFTDAYDPYYYSNLYGYVDGAEDQLEDGWWEVPRAGHSFPVYSDELIADYNIFKSGGRIDFEIFQYLEVRERNVYLAVSGNVTVEYAEALPPSPVPVPASLPLLAAPLAMFGMIRRRKTKG